MAFWKKHDEKWSAKIADFWTSISMTTRAKLDEYKTIMEKILNEQCGIKGGHEGAFCPQTEALPGLEKMFISLQAGQNFSPAGQISSSVGWFPLCISLFFPPNLKISRQGASRFALFFHSWALPPFPCSWKKKIAKISHFLHFLLFLPTQKHILLPQYPQVLGRIWRFGCQGCYISREICLFPGQREILGNTKFQIIDF